MANGGGEFFDPQHLRKVGYSYFGHMRNALSYGMLSLLAFLCYLIHAFLPFIFVQNGTNLIFFLLELRERHAAAAQKRRSDGPKS